MIETLLALMLLFSLVLNLGLGYWLLRAWHRIDILEKSYSGLAKRTP